MPSPARDPSREFIEIFGQIPQDKEREILGTLRRTERILSGNERTVWVRKHENAIRIYTAFPELTNQIAKMLGSVYRDTIHYRVVREPAQRPAKAWR